MSICKQTGLLKYGQRIEAVEAIHALGRLDSMQVIRCEHCRCLHIVPLPPDEIKTKRPPEPTRGTSGYADLEVSCISRETDKAFLCFLVGGEEAWVPKSLIAEADDYDVGDCDLTISVKEWFLAKLKEEGV